MNETTNIHRSARRHGARRNIINAAHTGHTSAGVLTTRELRTEVLAILG